MVGVDANIQDPIAARPNGKRAKFRHRFCGDRYTAFDLDRCFVGAADENLSHIIQGFDCVSHPWLRFP